MLDTEPFLPVIRTDVERSPEWYVVRYASPLEKVFFRVLNFVRQEFRTFTFFDQMEKRTRSWFPGYTFVAIDVELDRWQQLYRMPGFIEILGNPSPLPPGTIEDLDRALLKRIGKRDPGLKFGPGDTVRILRGAFVHHNGTVMKTHNTSATIVAMIFGRPTNITLSIYDIERVT